MGEEIEAKFRVTHPRRLRARMRALGFEAGPRRREQNWLFDYPSETLAASGRLLRLRRSGSQWLLTFKGPRRAGRWKRRQEIETAVNGEACRRLLERIGLRPVLRYARWRTLWRPRAAARGVVAWDETPIGICLELEGPARWIARTARALQLGQPEPRTYPELYGVKIPSAAAGRIPARGRGST